MKERILETADRLFYLRGIRAVGVDTVAAEIGISKRTLQKFVQTRHHSATIVQQTGLNQRIAHLLSDGLRIVHDDDLLSHLGILSSR